MEYFLELKPKMHKIYSFLAHDFGWHKKQRV